MTETEKAARRAQPEHRWPAVVATVIALAAYAFLPSVVPLIERYAVVGVCLLKFVGAFVVDLIVATAGSIVLLTALRLVPKTGGSRR